MTNVNNEVLAGWGQVGEENNGGQNTPVEKLEFLKLPFGDTKIRVLDAVPFMYKEWWSTRGNGGKGCSIGYFAGKDLLEAENQAFMKTIFAEADKRGLKDKARKDFLRDFGYKLQPWGKVKDKNIIHVLDRATGEIKLLNAGNGVFNAIKKFALNADYGDPRNYDITITKVDKKGKGNFQDIEYSVLPSPNKAPITAEEATLYNEKKIDLVKYKTPDYTPEQALMIAKGGTFQEVLGNGSETAGQVEQKTSVDQLPPQESGQVAPPAEEKAPEQPQTVDVNKETALSEEELNNISFG